MIAMIASIGDIFSDFADWLVGAIQAVYNVIISGFGFVIDSISDFLVECWTTLKDSIVDVWDTFWLITDVLWKSLVAYWNAFYTETFEILNTIMDDLYTEFAALDFDVVWLVDIIGFTNNFVNLPILVLAVTSLLQLWLAVYVAKVVLLCIPTVW